MSICIKLTDKKVASVAINVYLRYFLQKDNDRAHKVRIAIGNGVRAEVWNEFLNRFGNIYVRELYAATEGNIGFINYTTKVGVVGRVNFLHKVRLQNSKTIKKKKKYTEEHFE